MQEAAHDEMPGATDDDEKEGGPNSDDNKSHSHSFQEARRDSGAVVLPIAVAIGAAVF
jgi:hypothetical protein